MSQQIITAGEAMYAALRNVPCACTFEHPYEPRGKRKTMCGRCRSMAAWELAAQRLPSPGTPWRVRDAEEQVS